MSQEKMGECWWCGTSQVIGAAVLSKWVGEWPVPDFPTHCHMDEIKIAAIGARSDKSLPWKKQASRKSIWCRHHEMTGLEQFP